LDTALLRPGRIDKKYKVDYPEREEVEAMFLKYFPEKTKKAILFRDSIVGNNVTSAEIQQHFIKYQYSADLACKQRYELVDGAAAREARKKQDTTTNVKSYVSLW
jgi:SpoVK/Ycf46/Vps4 family AAA+-type ATPase